jgi:hypothetical protein
MSSAATSRLASCCYCMQPSYCLALDRKPRYVLKNKIMMTCGSSREHDVLDTKHGAHEKGSHHLAYQQRRMAFQLRQDEVGTSSSNGISTVWWFCMTMRWDGAIHVKQQR